MFICLSLPPPPPSLSRKNLKNNLSILTLAAFGFQEMFEHYHHIEGSMELPELNGVQYLKKLFDM